jgi:hypothetical protein
LWREKNIISYLGLHQNQNHICWHLTSWVTWLH